MRWIPLSRAKIRVLGKPVKTLMKGMAASEEHTHFLHSLLTNDIKGLRAGRFNYNLWLKQNGQPVGDFFVFRLSDSFLLDTEKPSSQVIEEFERLKLSLRVAFEDLSKGMGHVFLFGEGARDFVVEIAGTDPEEMSFVEREGLYIAKNPLRIGETGYDFMGKTEALVEKLSPGDEATPEEVEDLRIRRCVPRIGKELREGFSPLEAGVLKYAIDMNKGCYVGQEAIARVYFRGRTPRTLVCMEVEGGVEAEDKIYDGSKAVGLITSVDFEGRFALGYILRSVWEKGKELVAGKGKVRLLDTCEESIKLWEEVSDGKDG